MVAAVREDIHVELQLVTARDQRERARATSARCWTCSPRPNLAPPRATRGRLAVARVERLRVRRLGDTLLYLTGPPNEEDLGVRGRPARRLPVDHRRRLRPGRERTRDDRRPAGRRGRATGPTSPRPGTGSAHGEHAPAACERAAAVVGLVVHGRPLSRPGLQWSVAGRAGRRRGGGLGAGLGPAAAGAGLAGRCGVRRRFGRVRAARPADQSPTPAGSTGELARRGPGRGRATRCPGCLRR